MKTSRFTAKILIITIIFSAVFGNIAPTKAASSLSFVKAQGENTVYLLQNNKKYPIRSEGILLSYGVNFSQVRTISKQELASYPFATSVKSEDSEKIYHIDYSTGKKHWQATERIFLQYGNKFSDIITLSKPDLLSWDDVLVVKTTNNPTVYYLNGVKKHPIPTQADFLLLGFEWKDIVNIAQFDLDFYKMSEPLYAKNSETVKIIREKNPLSILYAKPVSFVAQKSLSAYTADNLYTKFTLSTVSEPVSINSIEFRQFGEKLGKNSFLYIRDSKTQKKIGKSSPLDADRFRVNFEKGELMLTPYEKKTLEAVVSIGGITSNVIGNGISLTDIESTANVEAETIRSPFYNIVFDKSIITRVGVDVEKVSNTENKLVLGSATQTIGKFRFRVVNQQEDVEIRELVLTNLGNYPLSALDAIYINGSSVSSTTTTSGKKATTSNSKSKNLQVRRKEAKQNYETNRNANRTTTTTSKTSTGVLKSSDVVAINGNSLTLNLSDRPIVISKSQDTFVTLTGVLKKGYDREVIQLVIDNPNDIELVGRTSEEHVLATPLGLNDSTFPIGDRLEAKFNFIRLTEGESKAEIAGSTPNTDLIAGSKQVVVASIDVKNGKSDAYLDQLEVMIKTASGKSLEGLLLIKSGGTVLGSANVNNFVNQYNTIKLRNTTTLSQNSSQRIDIVIDIPFGNNNDSYQALAKNFGLKYVDGKASYTINSQVSGNVLPVKGFSVSVLTNAVANGKTVTAGKAGQVVGSFTLRNDSSETVRVHKIELSDALGTLVSGVGITEMYISGSSDKLVFATETLPYRFDVNMTVSPNGKETQVNILMTTTASARTSVEFKVNTIVLEGDTSKEIITLTPNISTGRVSIVK